MKITNASFSLMVALGTPFAVAGCGAIDPGTSDPGETGTIIASLTKVPADTRCVVLYTNDPALASVATDVVPGSSMEIRLAPLKAGTVSVRGEAYAVACAQATADAGAAPTWQAPWTTAAVQGGVANSVTLVFRPSNELHVTLDFQDDSDGGTGTDGGADGGPPPGFWGDPSTIPAATKAMTFQFLNRTGGRIPDSQVYWSFQNTGLAINELHSIAEQSTYDMPAGASGRLYFYVVTSPADPAGSATAPRTSKYYDFIEQTVSATAYNGNTTRVDQFGLKIAMRLHCGDGYDVAVGEDYATFAETREQTFARFIAETPAEFAHLAQAPFAPYRIAQPTAGNFGAGKSQAAYMKTWIDSLWSSNGLTAGKPTSFCDPIAQPDLSAACHRHVGLGALTADGHVKAGNPLWQDGSTFYPASPTNSYAKFWHAHNLGGKSYGFPYDDVGGWSSFVSHANPKYMIVAIGF
jgi:hypothetical protein